MADESKAHTKSLNFTGRCFYSWRFSRDRGWLQPPPHPAALTSPPDFSPGSRFQNAFSMFLPFPLCRASPPHTAHPPNYDGVPGLENRCGPCGPQENWGRPVLFES